MLETVYQGHRISGREQKAGLPRKYHFGSIADVAENDQADPVPSFPMRQETPLRRYYRERQRQESACVRSHVLLEAGKDNVLRHPAFAGVLLDTCLCRTTSYEQGLGRIPSTSKYSYGVNQLPMIFLRIKASAHSRLHNRLVRIPALSGSGLPFDD